MLAVTRPWVGLSSWFNKRDCTPQYWYNGDDACGGNSVGEYTECVGGSYVFNTEGAHGLTSVENGVTTESRMAMAMVQNCAATLSDENMALLYAEQAKCGSFWVGRVELCDENKSIFSLLQILHKTMNTSATSFSIES